MKEWDWLNISISLTVQGEGDQISKKVEQEKRWVEILMEHVAKARLTQIYPNGAGPVDQDEAGVVFPSRDEMDAWLLLLPPVGGGRMLTALELQNMLQEHGITYGVDWNLLCSLSECSQRHFSLIHIASGKAPVPGRDGDVEECYSRERKAQVRIQNVGKTEYQVLNMVQPVEQGDVICRICLPTPGIPGHTVTGKFIPAPHGQQAKAPQGRNTQLSSDGRALVAACKGHLEFSGYTFQVNRVWDVYEADVENQEKINFLGDIHVHCDVSGGISICATGNIRIDGVLEDCTVQAGGNVVLLSGVQGQDQAIIQAQKSVYAKYIEHCQVYAQEDIYADCLINCQVYANRSVHVRTGRGALIGGVVKAAQEVSATTVGSKAESGMEIFLGGNPCQEAERRYIMREMEEKEREMAELESTPAQDREQRIAKLRLCMCVAKMKLEKMDKEEEERNHGDVLSYERCRLICDTIYPGTVLNIGRSRLTIAWEEHQCVLGLADGVIGRL